MKTLDTRNEAAKLLLKYDLDLTGASVKEVVDMLQEFGNLMYRKGVTDILTGTVDETIMSHEKTEA